MVCKTKEDCPTIFISQTFFENKNDHTRNSQKPYSCPRWGDGDNDSALQTQGSRLQRRMIWKDTKIYTLSNLPELLGVWQIVIDFFKK